LNKNPRETLVVPADLPLTKFRIKLPKDFPADYPETYVDKEKN